MLAGTQAVAHHGVLVHPDQAAGLADPAPLDDVFQERDHLLVRQPRVEQRCALAFGEAILAGFAVQHAALLVGTVEHADAQIVQAAFAVVRTVCILAAEAGQVVHDQPSVA